MRPVSERSPHRSSNRSLLVSTGAVALLLALGGCTGANLEAGLTGTGLASATTVAAKTPDGVALPPAAVPDAGTEAVESAAAKAGAGDEAQQTANEVSDAAVAVDALGEPDAAQTPAPVLALAPAAPTPPAAIPSATASASTAAAVRTASRAEKREAKPFRLLALAPTETRRQKREAFRARAEKASLVSPREAKAERSKRTVRIVKPRKADGAGVLPGVRSRSSLFQIGPAKTNDAARSFRVASAAGLARLSGNGLRKQTAHVKTECFKPGLVAVLRKAEQHFGRPVVVTSGYRSPKGNSRAGGAKGSKHMSCEAADVQIEGVSKWTLAKFFRAMPGRGGVGTYCHTQSVHVDIGSERDWNWKCRKRR